jgi:hypothetical protein
MPLDALLQPCPSVFTHFSQQGLSPLPRHNLAHILVSLEVRGKATARIEFPEDGQNTVPVHGLVEGKDSLGLNARVDGRSDVQQGVILHIDIVLWIRVSLFFSRVGSGEIGTGTYEV